MDFVSEPKIKKRYWVFAGTAFLMLVVACIVLYFEPAVSEEVYAMSFVFTILLNVFAFAALYERSVIGKRYAQLDAAKSLINRTYAVNINGREFDQLNYPSCQPNEDFRLYGSVTKKYKNSKNKLVDVTYCLYWENGKMHLAEKLPTNELVDLTPVAASFKMEVQ